VGKCISKAKVHNPNKKVIIFVFPSNFNIVTNKKNSNLMAAYLFLNFVRGLMVSNEVTMLICLWRIDGVLMEYGD